MRQKFFRFFNIYKEKLFLGVILILCASNFLTWSSVFEHAKKPDVEIYFFDVGQGDAHFVETRDGTQILIDGGPPNKILNNLSNVLDFNDRHIDAVILSHPHADHVSGLIEVLKNYEVDYVFESGVNYETPEVQEFRGLVGSESLKRVIVDKPLNLNFFGGAKLQLIYPDKSFEGKTLKQVHDSMVVAELLYNGKRVLFAGDMEKSVEE